MLILLNGQVAEVPKQKSQSASIGRPIVSAPHVLVCTLAQSAMSTICAAKEHGFGPARQIIQSISRIARISEAASRSLA